MFSIAILGASGVVGRRVVSLLLHHEQVDRIVALGRKELPTQHARLTSQAVSILDANAMMHAMPNKVDMAVCCIGTTIKQAKTKEAYRAIDVDSVLAFAQAAQQRGAKRFVLVSSMGASAKSWFFYLRTKAEVESKLAQMHFETLLIARPSWIDDHGTRTESRILEQLTLPVVQKIFGILGPHHRYAPISADTIARALVRSLFDMTLNQVHVFESDRLHSLGVEFI